MELAGIREEVEQMREYGVLAASLDPVAEWLQTERSLTTSTGTESPPEPPTRTYAEVAIQATPPTEKKGQSKQGRQATPQRELSRKDSKSPPGQKEGHRRDQGPQGTKSEAPKPKQRMLPRGGRGTPTYPNETTDHTSSGHACDST